MSAATAPLSEGVAAAKAVLGAGKDEAEGEKSGVGMKTEIKKCECGIVWKLKRIKSPFGIKDTDSIACSCGRKVITWSGGYLWVGEVMPDKQNSPDKENSK